MSEVHGEKEPQNKKDVKPETEKPPKTDDGIDVVSDVVSMCDRITLFTLIVKLLLRNIAIIVDLYHTHDSEKMILIRLGSPMLFHNIFGAACVFMFLLSYNGRRQKMMMLCRFSYLVSCYLQSESLLLSVSVFIAGFADFLTRSSRSMYKKSQGVVVRMDAIWIIVMSVLCIVFFVVLDYEVVRVFTAGVTNPHIRWDVLFITATLLGVFGNMFTSFMMGEKGDVWGIFNSRFVPKDRLPALEIILVFCVLCVAIHSPQRNTYDTVIRDCKRTEVYIDSPWLAASCSSIAAWVVYRRKEPQAIYYASLNPGPTTANERALISVDYNESSRIDMSRWWHFTMLDVDWHSNHIDISTYLHDLWNIGERNSSATLMFMQLFPLCDIPPLKTQVIHTCSWYENGQCPEGEGRLVYLPYVSDYKNLYDNHYPTGVGCM